MPADEAVIEAMPPIPENAVEDPEIDEQVALDDMDEQVPTEILGKPGEVKADAEAEAEVKPEVKEEAKPDETKPDPTVEYKAKAEQLDNIVKELQSNPAAVVANLLPLLNQQQLQQLGLAPIGQPAQAPAAALDEAAWAKAESDQGGWTLAEQFVAKNRGVISEIPAFAQDTANNLQQHAQYIGQSLARLNVAEARLNAILEILGENIPEPDQSAFTVQGFEAYKQSLKSTVSAKKAAQVETPKTPRGTGSGRVQSDAEVKVPDGDNLIDLFKHAKKMAGMR